MELFIIRHGESIGNLTTVDMPDGELSPRGREQAAEVAEGLAKANVTDIVSSPLMRAIETAQSLAQKTNLPIEVWKHTFEVRNKGAYKGPSRQRMSEMYPEIRCGEEMEEDGWFCAGDETEEDAYKRAKTVYGRLCDRFSGRRVALFAHSGFNRHLLYAALGMDYRDQVHFGQDNGCIYWLTIQSERTTLNYLGSSCVFCKK